MLSVATDGRGLKLEKVGPTLLSVTESQVCTKHPENYHGYCTLIKFVECGLHNSTVACCIWAEGTWVFLVDAETPLLVRLCVVVGGQCSVSAPVSV